MSRKTGLFRRSTAVTASFLVKSPEISGPRVERAALDADIEDETSGKTLEKSLRSESNFLLEFLV